METEEEFQAKGTASVFNKTIGKKIPNYRKRDT